MINNFVVHDGKVAHDDLEIQCGLSPSRIINDHASRHSGVGRDPGYQNIIQSFWTPAFVGLTIYLLLGALNVGHLIRNRAFNSRMTVDVRG